MPETSKKENRTPQKRGRAAATSATSAVGAVKPFFARKRVLIPLAIAIILLATVAMYYRPLKIWYREARQERVLREQLVAIRKYNSQLKVEIQSLETSEGIQDYARRELGLIQKGEHAVVVLQGGKPLKEPTNTREQEIQKLQDTAQPFGSWTPFLDALFGTK